MERLQKLSEFWNWLPAFRAVAETEHLPTASRQLRVSPSALSRTIRLLERRVGKTLFHRQKRSLRLTHAGQEFLGAVRDAMGLVDEGLRRTTGELYSGPLHVSVVGLFSYIVPPVIRRLQRQHPGLLPQLHNFGALEVNPLLLWGQLDVAFVREPVAHEQLVIESVGVATNGVYCGRRHPLYRIARPTMKQVLRHSFAAPTAGKTGLRADNWPPDIGRRIDMRIQQLHVAVDVCASGHDLAVLPDDVAKSSARALRRLPLNVIPPTQLFAVRRRQLVPGDLAHFVVEAVRSSRSPKTHSPKTGR